VPRGARGFRVSGTTRAVAVHEYDVALKNILTRPGSAVLALLTGASSFRWLNVEVPKVSNRRVDLLGEAPDGELTHIELQAANEKDFPLRMAWYLMDITERFGRVPRQVALYVGEPRLRMKNSLEGPGLAFWFELVDIRELDGVRLLASRELGDNVLAVLTRLGSQPDIVRRVLKRIAVGPAGKRDLALAELLIIAGLRRLTDEVKREAEKMPILLDIMDNEVFGPLIRKGLKQGRAEGQMELLVEMTEQRFGSIPPQARKRLESLKPAQVKAAGLRLLNAQRIEDLFPRSAVKPS
jgi:hypothetical protein